MERGGRVLAWRAHQLDELRARVRTKRPFVLDRDDLSPPARRGGCRLCLGDLAQPPPAPTWSPDVLGALATRVHGAVPRAPDSPDPTDAEGPFRRLDAGATHALWRGAVHVDGNSLRVPLWGPNRDLSVLAGVATAYGGFALSLVGGVGALAAAVAGLGEAPAPVTAPPHAALSIPLAPGALPVILAGAAGALLGVGLLVSGIVGTWRCTRRHDLQITQHGVRYRGRRLSFDEILGVRARNGGLVFELLDGSELATPEGSLEPLVAESLGDELQGRLPSPDERAAAFVAYERARRALGLT